jgi:5-methylcytosine-specific restriction protein A
MPLAPKRPCSRPYCRRLLEHGEQCPDHGPTARSRENDRQPRRAQKRRFYQTAAWRSLRDDVLAEEPVCKICRKAPSACVDHKRTVDEAPELALVRSNLQGACLPCHSAKTARLDGGFGNRRTA